MTDIRTSPSGPLIPAPPLVNLTPLSNVTISVEELSGTGLGHFWGSAQLTSPFSGNFLP